MLINDALTAIPRSPVHLISSEKREQLLDLRCRLLELACRDPLQLDGGDVVVRVWKCVDRPAIAKERVVIAAQHRQSAEEFVAELLDPALIGRGTVKVVDLP